MQPHRQTIACGINRLYGLIKLPAIEFHNMQNGTEHFVLQRIDAIYLDECWCEKCTAFRRFRKFTLMHNSRFLPHPLYVRVEYVSRLLVNGRTDVS